MDNLVTAILSVELTIKCPRCERDIDLMSDDIKDLNDEGHIIRQCCPDGYWTEKHEKFDEWVDCPSCKKPIHVKGIEW